MKNYQALLMIIAGVGLVIGMLNGTIQNYIGFADVLNEIMFTFVGGMIGLMGIIGMDYKKILKALI